MEPATNKHGTFNLESMSGCASLKWTLFLVLKVFAYEWFDFNFKISILTDILVRTIWNKHLNCIDCQCYPQKCWITFFLENLSQQFCPIFFLNILLLLKAQLQE